MKVSFKDNVLTISTGISKEDLGGKTRVFARNDKGESLYAVEVVEGAIGSLDNYSIKCNNIKEDGELQVIAPVHSEITEEVIKRTYADALIAAAKYIPQIAADVASKAAAVDALFE